MTFASPVPAPGADAPRPTISRDIYGMPSFLSIVTPDPDASADWYVRGLGLIDLFRLPAPDGGVQLIHLRRWHFQDILVRRADPSAATQPDATNPPRTTFSLAAVVDELDELAASARAHGAGKVEGPYDTAWNTRDLHTTDPDGNVVIFTAARPLEQRDTAFTATMTEGTTPTN